MFSVVLFSVLLNSKPEKIGSKYIEYELVTTIEGRTYKEISNLKCSHNESIFYTLPEKKNSVEIDTNDDSKLYVTEKKNNNYKVINLREKTLISYSQIDGKNYKITEGLQMLDWVISKNKKDLKKINNFLCNKATLSFRGRNYVAWYTKKLPFSFGPWKFCGLPGLILEIYDTNKAYHWTATKINNLNDETINLDIIEKSNLTEISLREYIKRQDEYRKSKLDLALKNLPKDIVPDKMISTTRQSIELKYEWEDQ